MTQNAAPLILVGAGYCHLLALQMQLAVNCPVKVILVNPLPLAPYSGMLPAFIGSDASEADISIDLPALCERTGCDYVEDRLVSINREAKTICLSGGANLPYSLLSLNTGPGPDHRIAGVAEHAISIKPIADFLQRWKALQTQLRNMQHVAHLVMVGGGAGSVETLIAIAQACQRDNSITHKPQLTLLTRASELLSSYPPAVRHAATARCKALKIEVLTNREVTLVTEQALHSNDSNSGIAQQPLAFDHLLWCTQASAPAWPAGTGLVCDERGFIAVNHSLQSSDPAIFACGDIAAFTPQPLPKAGVFSVRQAPVLRENLQRALAGQPLQAYTPQRRFLSLLNLGNQHCAGSYGSLAGSARWLWHWKMSIDSRFMQQFRTHK